jgi:ABC-type sugar transport system substrate-binding protein
MEAGENRPDETTERAYEAALGLLREHSTADGILAANDIQSLLAIPAEMHREGPDGYTGGGDR